MKLIFSLLAFTLFISAGDFQNLKTHNKYQKIDKNFTIKCDCGEPAKLYPYNGENIPFAKTIPCPINGCVN